jgi:hypothetical protein
MIKKYCDRCKKEQEALLHLADMQLCIACFKDAAHLQEQIDKANKDAWNEFCPKEK